MITFNFSENQLASLIPSNHHCADWYDVLQQELPKFEINTKDRIAAFLAQCGHESLDFTVLQENLNYSAERLLQVFPKYFSSLGEARLYERRPELIANKVYSNRLGNGDENSGDGWTYRGRGLIQITGKNNYRNASIGIFKDERVLDNPDYFITTLGAIQSACWFWLINNLNSIADSHDIKLLTIRINGGLNGFDDRLARYQSAMSIL